MCNMPLSDQCGTYFPLPVVRLIIRLDEQTNCTTPANEVDELLLVICKTVGIEFRARRRVFGFVFLAVFDDPIDTVTKPYLNELFCISNFFKKSRGCFIDKTS